MTSTGRPSSRDGSDCSAVDDVTLRFGGVRALDGVSFEVAPRRAVRGHRPQRRGQDLDLQLPQRRLPPAAGHGHARGRGPARALAGGDRRARRRAHVPEPRAVREPVGRRQPHARPPPPDEDRLPHRRAVVGPGQARGDRAPREASRRSSSCSSCRPTATRTPACCRTASRSASSSAARWRWSRSCCCSTSPSPA